MKEHFDIDAIEDSLRDFRHHFPGINESLSLHREPVTEEMVANMLAAYRLLNELLARDVDLFSLAGMHSLLELNHLVLCGDGMKTRLEYHQHIVETRSRFHKRISRIRKWVEDRFCEVDPFELAAGFYASALSRPQLFIEGNHRTGNIVLNYLLICQEKPPFIISSRSAFDYLELSGKIKFTNKEKLSAGVFKMPGYRKEFVRVLRKHTDERFVKEMVS